MKNQNKRQNERNSQKYNKDMCILLIKIFGPLNFVTKICTILDNEVRSQWQFYLCNEWQNAYQNIVVERKASVTNLKLKKGKNYIVFKLLLLFSPLCIFYFTTTTHVWLCFSTVRPISWVERWQPTRKLLKIFSHKYIYGM
jgi:hypothetical protein